MKKITLSIFTAGLLLSPVFGAEDLGEVVVTSSSKIPQKIKETTQNVTIVTAEDIKEHGYQSVPEVLSHTAGFTVVSNGGMGQLTSVFVRGLSSNNLLVLIDGVPLTDYTQPGAVGSLEHINIENVERIEIIKGGQSGIWGNTASAGTINIVTKGSSKDYASISLKAGSHNTRGIDVDLSKKFNNASLSLGVHRLFTDSISALAPRDAEKDGYKNNNYYIKGNFNINANNSVSLFYRNDKGEFDFDSINANDKISKGTNRQKIYGVEYHYNSDTLSIDAKIAHRKIDRSLNGVSMFGPWSYDTTGKSTQISLTGAYRFSNKASLTIGAEHNTNRAYTDNGFSTSNAKFKNRALFVSYSQTVESLLGADTTFNAVVRYNNFDKFDNKVTYRFGIKRDCKVVNGLHTSANIYTGYNAPSLFQFTNAATPLQPEHTKGYDISIGYKDYINVTYFSNKVKKQIIYAPIGFTINYANSKKDIKRKGLEVSSKYAFGDSGFVLGANFTHMFKFKDENGDNALRIPRNSASVSLDYYFGEASHIGLTANYVSKRRDIYTNPVTFVSTEVTLSSYTTVDLTYNTTFKDNLNLNLTVKNLFDKKYETVKGYSTEGRSFYANIEYKF